jgi:hypothetical protein
VFAKASMDEYVRRLAIHGAAPIPCVATSNTEEGARAVIRKHVGWSATILVIFIAMLVWAGSSSRARPGTGIWIGGTIAVLLLVVGLITWLKVRKLRDYRDPRIRVEIGPDEVAVIGPAGRDVRPYAALAPIEVRSGATKSSRYFIGIVLDTRLGPIPLEDDWYRPGKAAAGAILKRMDELGTKLVAH